MPSKSRIQLESWLKEIEVVEGNVLDIGGSQLPIGKRLHNTALYWDNYKILDLEQPHECKQKPDIVCDINKHLIMYTRGEDIYKDTQSTKPDIISTKEEEEYLEKNWFKDYFDNVFLLEVTEYLWNPIQAFKNINFFMKQGGILYLSTHFLYPIHNPKEEDYLRYTPNGIRKILKETGFEIVDERPRLLDNEDLYRGLISNEGMKPSKDSNEHNCQGMLIKCKKL